MMDKKFNDTIGEISNDFEKMLKKKSSIKKKCAKGLVPLTIIKSKDRYTSYPFTKEFITKDEEYGYILGGRIYKKEDIVVDTISDTAKQLEEIRKERVKLNNKQQRILKKAFKNFRSLKIPEVK